MVLVALAAGGWWWLRRDTAREVSISEARERLHSESPATGLAGRPAPGVYEYRGQGADELSLPPLKQSHGPGVPGSVELLGGDCWRFRLDYSSNHWQEWTYCTRGRDLVETGGQTWQRWMFGPAAVTNLTRFECSRSMLLPASREPGQRWPADCTGSSDRVSGEMRSAGPYTFVGDETLHVGGVEVAAVHFRRHRTLSGAQEGSDIADLWFAAETGLPLRDRRKIVVRSDSPVGTTTYTETGSFRLVSLRPR